MLAARARLVPGLPLMRSAFSSGRSGPSAAVLWRAASAIGGMSDCAGAGAFGIHAVRRRIAIT
jgi:hypothetical protein